MADQDFNFRGGPNPIFGALKSPSHQDFEHPALSNVGEGQFEGMTLFDVLVLIRHLYAPGEEVFLLQALENFDAYAPRA